MPRQPKPYYRKYTKSWYCTIQGNRILLGKDKETAFARFHEIMANQHDLASEVATCYQLTQIYLDWCLKNRAKGTYDNHRRYLKSFIASVGKQLKVSQLRKKHITKWTDEQGYVGTSANDAISVVQRAFNWAVDEGHLRHSPIAKIRKPRRRRREIFYTKEQWKQICSHVTDDLFRDLLDFLWSTGCRPKEARDLEARHVHDNVIIFPASEAKGENNHRVIFLASDILELVKRLVKERPTGPLFVNRRGNPWTKDAIKCRLQRISDKVGFRVIAYGARHAYATNALINGIDPISLSHLMGHNSVAMISRVYSHLAKSPEFLMKQAEQAKKRA